MASRYEVEVNLASARNLKNVNWRHGPLKPYAVVWVDPNAKCSTRVEDEGDTCPYWNQKLVIPLNRPIEDSTLCIDVVHAVAADEDTKPLIGSARLPLRDVVDHAGVGQRVTRKLELKRSSGRPQGELDVDVAVREPRYRAPDPYYAPPYGVPPTSRDWAAPPPSGYPYGGVSPYGQPQPAYGQAPPAYGQASYGQEYSYGQPRPKEEKSSKFGGMGTGLAVGAAAGVLGGLAIGEGVEYVEDKIADDAAERVEEADLEDDEDDNEDF